jgi:hypothetical protein
VVERDGAGQTVGAARNEQDRRATLSAQLAQRALQRGGVVGDAVAGGPIGFAKVGPAAQGTGELLQGRRDNERVERRRPL